MKQTFITLTCATLALVASACTTDNTIDDNTADTHPNTPVTLTIALTSNGAVTRTNTNTDLANKYLAVDEITKESTVLAGIFLPALRGYKACEEETIDAYQEQAMSLVSGKTLSTLALINPEPSATPLYMKHLDLNEPLTAGFLAGKNFEKLLHFIYGSTTRTVDATPSYTFEMKHGHTKLSVLIVDPAGNPINDVKEVTIKCFPYLSSSLIYGSSATAKEGHCTLKHCYKDWEGYSHSFVQPNASLKHLWNTTVGATRSTDPLTIIEVKDKSGAITTAPNGIDISTAELSITLAAYTILDGNENEVEMPVHTYTLPLGEVQLNNLSEGDPRLSDGATQSTPANGTLKHTLSSEHLVLTVVIDKKALISATATATVSKWQIATANANAGDADTNDGQILPPTE